MPPGTGGGRPGFRRGADGRTLAPCKRSPLRSGAAHGLMFDRAGDFNTAVLDFLARVEAELAQAA